MNRNSWSTYSVFSGHYDPVYAIDVEPLVDTASKLAHEFRSMLSDRQAEMLSDWIQRASKCGIEPLKSFVGGMKNDLVAISLPFSLPWSHGPTEGNVNWLKLINRQT